jgi:hypothetical protein
MGSGPIVTMMDYEHQPANHLAFRLANLVLLPEALPIDKLVRFGLDPRRAVHYRGLKEDIALSTFVPDAGFRSSLGLSADEVVAVVRPAAEGALYHRFRNDLCSAIVERLAGTGATVLVVPRTASQGHEYRKVKGARVLAEPISGPDLLYHADAVVGAGGTMTREAAVLGTPTWSIFEGKPAAVDAALVAAKRMRLLRRIDDLPTPRRVPRVLARQPRPEVADRFVEFLRDAIKDLHVGTRKPSRARRTSSTPGNLDGRE